MAAAAPPAASSDFYSLPVVKLYQLLKSLNARGVNLYTSWDAQFPESFHMLNIDNFDSDTLLAMFEDLVKDDMFYHNLQGLTLSFRIIRGSSDFAPPNILNILNTIKLATCLGAQGVTFTRNNDIKTEEAGYSWQALPQSIPAAQQVVDDIKKGYAEDYPNQPFDEAVLEFKPKSEEGGILIKVIDPNRLAASAMKVDVVAPPAVVPLDVKPAGGKRQRVDPTVVVAAPPAAATVNLTISNGRQRVKKGG